MPVPGVLDFYQTRLRDLQQGYAPAHSRNPITTAILIAALAALGLFAIRKQMFFLLPLLSVPVIVLAVREILRQRQSRYRAWRLRKFYQRGIERLQSTWAGTGLTGQEFADPNHVYAADLNILGDGSLFQLLCIARTNLGKRGLANYLLHPPSLDETRLRQGAVNDLRERTGLRENIAILGEFEFLHTPAEAFETWLDGPSFSFPAWLWIPIALTSTVLATLILAVFTKAVPWSLASPYIWPLVALHAVIGIHYRQKVNETLEHTRALSVETQVVRAGLALFEQQHFTSPKLRQLVNEIHHGSHPLQKLERLFGAVQQRDKEWFFLPSRLLLIGTQLAMALEKWRRQHGESLRTWLAAWEEFEALSSLAAYCFENPQNTFPQLLDGEACFEAVGLTHPLLPFASAVPNDVTLHRETPFYIVSGSNMSGKSTLLRSIGLNSVLAFAGAPVTATSLRLSGLSVFASLSLVDSLLNGRSKFFVEVDRLKQAIESTVAHRSVLFLVDEIFSGTNSRDRRIAAEAVVRTLVQRGGIGALSTHDLALTEIAGALGLSGINVHMGSRDQQDPLAFDYRLKIGVTRETNALAIARMAGVPVQLQLTRQSPDER